MNTSHHTILAALCLPLCALAQSAVPETQEARLLRYPHIQADKIAFTHGGDIWTASSAGGRAHRVTSYDAGLEIFPRISPNGEWIAFSGEYSGTRQIYLIPYSGGEPRQLTFYPDVGTMPPRGGYDNLVLDWTPDGEKILIRANRTPYGRRVGRYFLVDPWNRGLEQPLQIPEGGPASFSPDGRKLSYNIISREWRTWKRYSAGRAQDVYIYDLEGNTIEQLTDFVGTDNWPMWLGDKIYYTSDQTGTLNIYAYDLAAKSSRQVTEFSKFDVLFPARGDGGLIFECGGHLYVMSQRDEAIRKLRITLADDLPWTRPIWKEGASSFGSFDPSPSAKRAVVEFRGDLFSVPTKHGEVKNLTATSARREMQPAWSPDGKSLAYLAEHGEDYEIFILDLATGNERQLTRASGTWTLSLAWSPDSNKLAITDKRNELSVLDVTSGDRLLLDQGPEAGISQVSWSADSAWLTYRKISANAQAAIWICRANMTDPRQVTGDDYAEAWPSFDPAGDYLYFVSARDFVYNGYRFDQRLYALLLREDVTNPITPLNDEEPAIGAVEASAEEEQPEADQASESEVADLQIEFVGLGDRLVALPGSPGSYRTLVGIEGGLLFFEGGDLKQYSHETRETETVIEGLDSFALTPDRKNVLFRHDGDLHLAKVAPEQKVGEGKIDLSQVRMRIEPKTEWRQMYNDAWRIMRDWFYDPNMHGVDWVAMREKYAPLLPHMAHRSDLDFLLGELVGELNCGHTYIISGENPRVDREQVGTLGADLELHEGRYRFAKIFDSENWNDATRSPLREPGVKVQQGEYLIAIDGQELAAGDNPYRFLIGKVDREVTLSINLRPQVEGSREVKVRPIASEQNLRYITWVNRNRRIVDELSGGRIGYLHAPNTSVAGHEEVIEGWRSQARVKEAMIIDDRYNGGGFVPSKIAAEIGQGVLNYWARRSRELSTTPTYAFDGPRLMLINGYSSSGGDAFPFYFRKLGLGMLMGKRTWGGLVGYSGSPRLLDGGGMAVPSFAFVNTDGEWDVEAVGVTPDIEVFDDPTLIQAGTEPMLEAAVKHLLEELKQNPKPKRPVTPRGPKRDQINKGGGG